MSLTSRDVEEAKENPLKVPPFTNFIIAIVRIFAKIPAINKLFSESLGGLSGSIFRCWDKKEYEKATKLAIYALDKIKKKRNTVMVNYDWWCFLKYGVDSARYIENEDLREKLIEYANSSIGPIESYDIAYSYLEFSRWRYQSKNYKEAVKYAEFASRADTTWAEPDFILGWYGLLLSTGEAEEHLCKAIEKDERVLFRIANNDICKQYPHIINKLKEKYGVSV